MFNKVSVKNLTIVFIVLLALVAFDSMIGTDKLDRSFSSELTSFDSASVTQIIVHPKGGDKSFSFEKQNNRWLIVNENGKHNADHSQINSMITSLYGLKAKRLAAKSKDKWTKYELDDSLSIRVELKGAEGMLADIYVGKFSYTQPPRQAQQNPYMQQRQQGIMTSYVRIGNEEDVYAVDGFLSMTFGRRPEDFRDSRLLHTEKDSIARISFDLAGNTYQLVKNDSIWMVNGLLADSASVADYLSGISYLRSTDYLASDAQAQSKASHTVILEHKNGSQIAKVDAFYKDSTSVSVTSTLNPGTLFDGAKSGVFEKLYKNESYFRNQD